MYPGHHAQTRPDHLAVVMESGRSLTYAELDRHSIALARLLRERGLRTGDTIALLAENDPIHFVAYWAAVRSGLYVVPLNRSSTVDEAAYVLGNCDARALLVSARMRETATGLLPVLDAGESTGAHRVAHRFAVNTDAAGPVPGYEALEPLLAAQDTSPLADQPRGYVMLYSSGTTGRPKGVRRPLPGVQVDDPRVTRTSSLARAMAGFDADMRYLVPAPLYHSAGVNWSTAVQDLGGTVVVMDRWDPERFLALVEEHRITHTQVVPTMMVRLLKLPREVRERYDLSSLTSFVHAAAPCPPDVKREMIAWLGPVVEEYYAGTEGNGVTWIRAEEWLEHPGSVGRSVDGIIHICNDAGRELPPGEVGTVFFEKPVAPFEYHGDEAKTRGSRHPQHDNWSAIGDLGHVDEDGYLYLSDRRSFLIISGGVNIYPAEIESCLVMHPAVADVAVVGLPDPDMGELVHAVVQPAPGVTPSPELAEELLGLARTRLSRHKVPRRLEFRDELPRMESGKLRKEVLRRSLLAEGVTA